MRFPTYSSLGFGNCPLRKTDGRGMELKNQIESTEHSLSSVLGASGSVPCVFPSVHHSQGLGLPSGRNVAASLWLDQRLLLPQEENPKVSPVLQAILLASEAP